MSFVRSLVSTTRYLRPTSSLRPLRSIHTSKALFAADPFPFSLDPSLISSTGQKSDGKEEWPLPEPLDRSHEDESALRARLVYQTRKRGTLETDLLLSTFARDQLGSMSVAELKQFDKVSSRTSSLSSPLLPARRPFQVAFRALLTFSCSMSQIGISSIGQWRNVNRPPSGRIRSSWKSKHLLHDSTPARSRSSTRSAGHSSLCCV